MKKSLESYVDQLNTEKQLEKAKSGHATPTKKQSQSTKNSKMEEKGGEGVRFFR